MTAPKIFVQLDHNELTRPRAAKVEKAVLEDDRFEMRDPADLPFDLRFSIRDEDPIRGTNLCNISEKVFHVELKDFSEDVGSDYLASILNGHLWGQVLVARELQQPLAIVVLGDDNDVGAAIRKAASRNHGQTDPEKLMEYFRMVEGFEANCIGLHIQVWRLKTDPNKRMLLRVRKILESGDLSGFAPAPAEGERQAVGLSILAGKGIGPAKAAGILSKFKICMYPTSDDTYLDDCDGIGPKLAPVVGRALNVPLGLVCRPPKPKKSKAKAKEATA
ncbi:hypothetical protein M0R72_17210 [Candidatus Pacearchaeota archaeon]|jgi:hypothetical protein|nr:hypothetical protein [Candidatus Pacearchaeota archaeon]